MKELVEGNLPAVLVRGELSNVVRASSGHIYLTLKDANAQLRGVMWRTRAARLRFEPEDGLQVVAAGGLEVYAARGTYQISIEDLVPVGVGPLELAFRQLHDKLAAAGLFDPAHKRPLPVFPRRIALVTSPTGAAVRDMLQVLARRWPGADVVIVPVPVQGAEAAPKIAAALGSVHRIPGVEVVITGRGGGSLEDLWAFNEEAVARAIYTCKLPVISAVGHEIDVTIADLVADRRALTPSEAAELVLPDATVVRGALDALQDRLTSRLMHSLANSRAQLAMLAANRTFTRPFEAIRNRQRQLDDLDLRLGRGVTHRLTTARTALAAATAQLNVLNPLAVLARGYSITTRDGESAALTATESLTVGDRIYTRLAQGSMVSEVQETFPS